VGVVRSHAIVSVTPDEMSAHAFVTAA